MPLDRVNSRDCQPVLAADTALRPPQALLIFGKPRAVTDDIVRKQDQYVITCLVLQLLTTALVCMVSYQVRQTLLPPSLTQSSTRLDLPDLAPQPLNALLTALEKRGFLKKEDRPTLLRVRPEIRAVRGRAVERPAVASDSSNAPPPSSRVGPCGAHPPPPGL